MGGRGGKATSLRGAPGEIGGSFGGDLLLLLALSWEGTTWFGRAGKPLVSVGGGGVSAGAAGVVGSEVNVRLWSSLQ